MYCQCGWSPRNIHLIISIKRSDVGGGLILKVKMVDTNKQ